MAHIFTNSQVHGYPVIRLVICFCLFFAVHLGEAQQTTDKKTLKLLSKADDLLKDRAFAKAKGVLIDAIERDPRYEKSYQKLFIVLRVLAQESDLIFWQQQYVEAVPNEYTDSGVWQNLASYHHSKGEYEKALELITLVDQPDSILLKSIQFSIRSLEKPDNIIVNEMPGEINQLQFQYLPVLTLDGRSIIFTGIKSLGKDEDIYQATYDGEKWQNPAPVSDLINTPYNEGACSISADGRVLIFTACEGRRTVGNCDLYIAKKEGDQWVDIRNMGKTVNSRFWDSQPSLSADGRTLYFVSNRPGGVGGRDIWKSNLVEGEWSTPENVGTPINTRRDETTPYIFPNGRTFFFSSNGHIGMGGYDLYKVENLAEEPAIIENLGSPINSHNQEVSLFVSSDGLTGYFAKEEVINGKIVSSRLNTYRREADYIATGVNYLTGTVRNGSNDQPLSANIELVNLKTRKIEYQTASDSKNGHYFLVLPSGKEYGVFVEQEGFLPEELSFITEANNETDTINFFLKPIAAGAKMVLRNIYFDFDSDEIKLESFEELDRIVQLLKNNPEVRVQITGHTDDIGAESYNQNLSEKRAKAVYSYLISAKIDANRLDYKGYGSKNPLFENDSEGNRQKNRRIEFEILSVGD